MPKTDEELLSLKKWRDEDDRDSGSLDRVACEVVWCTNERNDRIVFFLFFKDDVRSC